MKLRVRTSAWQRIREHRRQLDHEFARHLRRVAAPTQIAFQRLMSATEGNPQGVECRHVERDAWAFVLPNASGGSPWRVQYFDRKSFSGHECFNTLLKAIEDMVVGGYQIMDAGALDRCGATREWAVGTAQAEIITMHNRGDISWPEAVKRLNAVAGVTA